MIVQWLLLLPIFAAMLVVAVLPGFFWVRSATSSTLVALAAGPSLTFAVVALGAQVFHMVGIPWGRLGTLLLLTASTFAGLAVFTVRRRRGASAAGDEAAQRVAPPLTSAYPGVRAHHLFRGRAVWPLAACITAGVLLAALPTLWVGDPANPPQQWDSTYHLNAVWNMLRTGDASMTTGTAPMYGGRAVFYPTAWHAFTALFALPTTVVQAANVSSLMLMTVWTLGATAMTSVLTSSRVATCAAAVVSGLMLSMPADALTMYNQWPNATGVALIPGVVAMAVLCGRRLRRDLAEGRGVLGFLPLFALLLVCTLGAVLSHPSTAFSLAALLLPALLAGCWEVFRWAQRRERMDLALASALCGVLVMLVVVLALTSDKVEAMGNYPRSGLSVEYALTHFLTPAPPFVSTIGLTLTVIVFGLLTLAGTVAMVRERSRWKAAAKCAQRSPRPVLWPIAAFCVLALLTYLAYAPDSAVRTFFTAPWYRDPRRIMGVENAIMVPLVAVGFDWLVTWLRAHRPRATRAQKESSAQWRIALLAGVWVVALTLGGAMDARWRAAAYVFDPENLGKPGMANTAELEMIRRMPQTLSEDAVVLGDPIAGAAYTEVLGQRTAVFPQLSTVNEDTVSQDALLKHFNEWRTDPAVCKAIHEVGVTHVYLDEDGNYYNFLRSERAPGLYGHIDVSSGFEKVDEGGTASLWRFTGCD